MVTYCSATVRNEYYKSSKKNEISLCLVAPKRGNKSSGLLRCEGAQFKRQRTASELWPLIWPRRRGGTGTQVRYFIDSGSGRDGVNPLQGTDDESGRWVGMKGEPMMDERKLEMECLR